MTIDSKDLPAIILAIGVALPSIITCVATLRASKERRELSRVTNAKVDAVHVSTNGKMEELLRVTSEAAHAKGVKDEKESPS